METGYNAYFASHIRLTKTTIMRKSFRFLAALLIIQCILDCCLCSNNTQFPVMYETALTKMLFLQYL